MLCLLGKVQGSESYWVVTVITAFALLLGHLCNSLEDEAENNKALN